MIEYYPDLTNELFSSVLDLISKEFSVPVKWRIELELLQNLVNKLTDEFDYNSEYTVGGALAFSILKEETFNLCGWK